jgi:hypothetical protein
VIVALDQKRYLLDPGYLLQEPLLLPESGLEVHRKTAMNTVVLRNEQPDVYSLFTIETGQTKWRYRLRATPVARQEFEQYWIRSFSLNTMEQLMLSRLDQGARLYFRKDRLECVSQSNRTKKHLTPADVSELSTIFGVPGELIRLASNSLSARPSTGAKSVVV